MTRVEGGGGIVLLPEEAREIKSGGFDLVELATRETTGGSKLNLYTPPAMEGYFDELSEAVKVGADETILAGIAARYSMEIVGPVPPEYLREEGAGQPTTEAVPSHSSSGRTSSS